ncbi:hydrogen peroxide-inducible genes activator [uncultured Thiohalocapsa sp.]|uniref:hydrogen peroxide-inducible genes activator n=1 Tax=uncultured Thiohalocapsa sp. TaxID=768990 RepID=UPI0025E9FA4B|nr:hydrogen peroxide-inducible genes activator [uncultured Thiohalocapsa sp.]
MTLNELRYVVALARERHFGRAADACFVSQPTLSVAVKKLEDELGVSLFERGTGEVTITDIGAAVVARAQRVLEEADGVLAVARSGRDPLVGPLRLGAIYTVGPYLLPRLVPALTRAAPSMPLIIEEDFTTVLAERLKRAQLDLIVISLPFDEPGIQTLPLYDEDFVVLLPGGHPWARRPAIEPADLAGERVLLLGPGHCFRDQVLAVCPQCANGGAEGPDGLGRGLQGSSLETIRCMVASNVGITVLPMSAAREDRLGGQIVCARPFTGAAPSRRVALAWRKSFPRVGAVEAVAAAVRGAELGDGIALAPADTHHSVGRSS